MNGQKINKIPLVYAIFAIIIGTIIDIIQLLLTFTGIGIAINFVIDIVTMLIVFICLLLGNYINRKTSLVFGLFCIIELIPGLDTFSLWSVLIFWFYVQSKYMGGISLNPVNKINTKMGGKIKDQINTLKNKAGLNKAGLNKTDAQNILKSKKESSPVSLAKNNAGQNENLSINRIGSNNTLQAGGRRQDRLQRLKENIDLADNQEQLDERFVTKRQSRRNRLKEILNKYAPDRLGELNSRSDDQSVQLSDQEIKSNVVGNEFINKGPDILNNQINIQPKMQPIPQNTLNLKQT